MKKTLLFYSLAIVTAATAMAGLRHTQKAPAALDAKLEALTAKPHSPSLREIGSEIVLVSEDFAKFTAGSEDDPDGTELSDWNDGTIDAKYTQQPGWRGGFVYQAGDVYAYTVQAFRLDSSSNIIEEATSDRSEPQEVKRNDAVESITAGNDGATVATTADGIRITLAEAAPVAVYSLDGRLLHQDNTAATEHNVALGNHGIFLVRIGAKTIKVVR